MINPGPDSDLGFAIVGLPEDRFFRALAMVWKAVQRPVDLVDLDEGTPFTRMLLIPGRLLLVARPVSADRSRFLATYSHIGGDDVNTEIFIANESDLTDDLLTEEPISRFPALVSWGLYPMQLSVLMAIINGMDLSDTDAVEELGEDPILDGGESGPWVLRFPTETVEHLRALGPEEAELLAAKWWKAGDWNEFGIKKGAFIAWWNALLALLREHAGTGQVYYWVDLR